jgi:hypothetical protein
MMRQAWGVKLMVEANAATAPIRVVVDTIMHP